MKKLLRPAFILFACAQASYAAPVQQKTLQHITLTDDAQLTTVQRIPTDDVSTTYQVSILSDIAESYNKDPARHHKNINLSDIKIAVDSEQISLEQVVEDIIQQAEKYTGPWHVKWRLKPENTFILEQKVNLIAQGSLNDFMFHLTERVKNMTGTQLFVSTFDTARVIVISDTYY